MMVSDAIMYVTKGRKAVFEYTQSGIKRNNIIKIIP